MICGRLCSGKTTYARRLIDEGNAVLLSIDEVMLAMFGQHCGDMHDEYAARAERYLLKKSLEVIAAGADVILDWGFWQSGQRRRVKEFYSARNVESRLHMLDVDDETWRRRIEMRNAAVASGETGAYYVDENLAEKFFRMFVMPAREEIDVWVNET